MSSVKELAKGRTDIYRMSPFDLEVKDGWNSRDLKDQANVEHIDNLAKSIAKEGVKEVLTVYSEDGKVYVENGHCRLAGALKAISDYGASKELTVPVKLGDKNASDADRIFSQITRNSGKPLSPLETAAVFKKLKALGLSDNDIASKTNVSRVYVGHLIELSKAPKEIIHLVKTGMISATLAIETLKECDGDTDRAVELLKAAVNQALESGKSRATKKHVKAVSGDEEGESEGDGEGDSEPTKAKEKKPKLKDELQKLIDKAGIDVESNMVVFNSARDLKKFFTLLELEIEDYTSEEESEDDVI